MSRIYTPPRESATGESAAIFEQIKEATGSVPNCYAAVGLLRPAALKSILQADGVLAARSLSKQDQEIVKLVVSTTAHCDYCISAHSLLGILSGLTPDVVRQIRDGQATGHARRDALVQFVQTLVRTRGTISDEAYLDIKEAGYTDAQLVDISLAIAVTTFTNVFNRINDTPIDLPAFA